MLNCLHYPSLFIVPSWDPLRLGMSVTLDESFHILSLVSDEYLLYLLPALSTFQYSVFLAIAYNVLWIHCGCLYLCSFPTVWFLSFAKPVPSSANFANLLANRYENLCYVRSVALVLSLFWFVAELSAHFENVLNFCVLYLAVEHFSLNFLLIRHIRPVWLTSYWLLVWTLLPHNSGSRTLA